MCKTKVIFKPHRISKTNLDSNKVSLNLAQPSDTESNKVLFDANVVCENASTRARRIVLSSSLGGKLISWYTSVTRKYTCKITKMKTQNFVRFDQVDDSLPTARLHDILQKG